MPRITQAEAQAWGEATKFTVPDISASPISDLLTHIETEVIARLSGAHDVSGWANAATTPSVVRTAISKKFIAWLYRRQYSESIEDNDASYSALLDANAELLIQGLISGAIEIPGVDSDTDEPLYYPTDASSAMVPTAQDSSLGPAKFSMGMTF